MCSDVNCGANSAIVHQIGRLLPKCFESLQQRMDIRTTVCGRGTRCCVNGAVQFPWYHREIGRAVIQFAAVDMVNFVARRNRAAHCSFCHEPVCKLPSASTVFKLTFVSVAYLSPWSSQPASERQPVISVAPTWRDFGVPIVEGDQGIS